jgi:predicted lipoprotein
LLAALLIPTVPAARGQEPAGNLAVLTDPVFPEAAAAYGRSLEPLAAALREGGCGQPARPEVAAAFAAVAASWGRLQPLLQGPLGDPVLASRVAFWPDPHGTAGRQLGTALAARDPGVTDPASLAGKSAALSGLHALERLLFDGGGGGNADPGFACAYAAAILAVQAERAREAAETFAVATRDPGPLRQGLFATLRDGLDGILRLKLEAPLGKGLAGARGQRAEFWRSSASLAVIDANLTALEAVSARPNGLAALLQADPESAAAAAIVEGRLADTRRAARAIPAPLADAVQDPAGPAGGRGAGDRGPGAEGQGRRAARAGARRHLGLQRPGRGLAVPPTIIARRDLLVSLTAALALRAGAAAAAPGPLWLGCRSGPARDRHEVAGFDASGAVRLTLPLPARGHAVTPRPGRDEAVTFARRPGSFAVVFAPEAGVVARRFDTPPDRHFHGHGVFDPTGRLLVATENDRTAPRGVLGIYDADDGYRRLGEIPSHGIEPHEVVLLPDGRTLAAANGGMVTGGPDGRQKLNLDTMEPALAYVELGSGRLLGEARPPAGLRRLSVRHLAVVAGGRVAVGMQWEGDTDAEVPPLVGLADGSGLRLLEAPPEVGPAMAAYVGSVAADSAGRFVAASCPRGGIVTFWDAAEGRFAGSAPLPDVCGVAPDPGGPGRFALSSGTGALATVGEGWRPAAMAGARGVGGGLAWDNHLRLAWLPG